MGQNTTLFNSVANYNVHFLNPKASLQYFDGEKRPQQNATNFTDMFEDIRDTAPKFLTHLIQINSAVLGKEKTKSILKEAAIHEDSSPILKDIIEKCDLDALTDYYITLYNDKLERIENLYNEAEDILDLWVEEHKGSAKIYDFPAFQDFFLKHPLNKTGAPLDKDHGADERYALETPLFRICLKSPYSALSKLFSDYKSPDTPDAPFKKELLTDIQRARIVSPDANVYGYIREASHFNKDGLLTKNSADNIGATLEDNRLVAPKKMTGHRVFFQKFNLPTDRSNRGSMVELQILPKSIMDVNDITHILMDKADDLLNVPHPSLTSRIHANFLYNLCSVLHRRCAEIGGFNKLVGAGLAPVETILNMMHNDQRPEVTSAVLSTEIAVENILLDIRNGRDISNDTETLLETAEAAVKKSIKNWRSSEGGIYNLLSQLDDRIELIIGDKTKHSAKDQREAEILQVAKRLIYDQVSDTNILPPLHVTNNTSANTDSLKNLLASTDPAEREAAEKLVQITETTTINVILGYTPNASRIISHVLGLVNAECLRNAPDKRALSEALNKYAVNTHTADDTAQEHYEHLLNRKRNIEYYANQLSNSTGSIDHYIGIQRDIFGNINTAVEYKGGNLRHIDTQRLKNMFAHSYERIQDPVNIVPAEVRKEIAKKVVRHSYKTEVDAPPPAAP